MGRVIEIPFKPREHQKEIVKALKRFSILVCHRRFGKTVLSINLLIRDALRTDKKNWRGAYLAPLYRQAKAVAWDYLKQYTLPVPGRKLYENELRCDFPNGSRITLLGADNPDSLRGLYLDGVVLDEVAQMRPQLWAEVVMPTLADRLGWAVFIGTPKGHNQFYDLWETAQEDDGWLSAMYKASETGVLPDSELHKQKKQQTPEQYQQEYECSFQAAIIGAYYGKLMEEAEEEGRIRTIPVDPILPVHTAWDLGIGDSTPIWFFQVSPGGEIRIVDYYENSGEGLDHYVNLLHKKAYVYGKHLLPHDVNTRELGTGRTRLETLNSLGLLNIEIVEKLDPSDGINAVRTIIPRCWFDRDKCKVGIEALKQYRRDYNEKMGIFRDTPLHDWTSHPADGFRYLAVGLHLAEPKMQLKKDRPRQQHIGPQGWMAA